MSIFYKNFIKFILATVIAGGGFFTAGWLAMKYSNLFIILAIIIFIAGAHYISVSLKCPRCSSPMFARSFLKGLFVMPWISTKCYKCGKDFLEKTKNDEAIGK